MDKVKVSRRRFGAGAVAATIYSASTGETAAGGTPQQPEPSSLPPEQAGEVDARLGQAVRRYGDRLSDAQRQRLRRVLTQNVRMMSAISAFPLQNGDTPATTLKLAVEKAQGNETCPKADEHAD